MTDRRYADAVNAQYAPGGDLAAHILAALRAVGKDADTLQPDDLAPVDQFHTGGKAATLRLARRAGITAAMHVLDLGGGLGGAARTLAAAIGCTVTVLDLTEEYCRVGALLTARAGLADRVSFRHGDAAVPPFAERSFDTVWMQHSSMNIADTAALAAGAFRVLRPGGRLALHEIMAGPVQPIHFPVPWAREPSISFLQPPDAVRALLHDAGFHEIAWEDETAASAAWFRARVAASDAQSAPPPLGLHLLLGAETGTRIGNVLRNLAEGRVKVVQAVYERPGRALREGRFRDRAAGALIRQCAGAQSDQGAAHTKDAEGDA